MTGEIQKIPLPELKKPSWVDDKRKYETLAHSIEPSVKLVTKDAWYWKVMAALAMTFTFGGMKYRDFLEKFGTTLGPIQGFPRSQEWLTERIIVHEARHTRQCKWFGLWIHPWVGLPIFAVFYLFLPLPLGLAYFRYRLELDADRTTWRWMLNNKYTIGEVRTRAEEFASKVGGRYYGWSVPWAKWGFKRAVESVIIDYMKERSK